MITFEHQVTGVVTDVMTPEERAAEVPDGLKDRTRRRQAQLIAAMDSSVKWRRVSAGAVRHTPEPSAADSATAHPTPPQVVEAAAPVATPDAGPKFTRVVRK